MKVHFMSDLHLEFAPLRKRPDGNGTMPGGDVLVLNGDITLTSCLDPKRTDSHNRKLRTVTHEFFNEAVSKYDYVLYTYGNHEGYGYIIDDIRKTTDKFLPHVGLMEQDTIIINGVAFMCACLWTDMDRQNPITMLAAGRKMNDYNCIEKRVSGHKDGLLRTLHPDDTVAIHRDTMVWLRSELIKHADKNCVVVTHMAPSRQGISLEHVTSDVNGAYASDLEDFIMCNPHIKHWIHGHTHIQKEYRIGECMVHANCRGYDGVGKWDFKEACARTFSTDTHFTI